MGSATSHGSGGSGGDGGVRDGDGVHVSAPPRPLQQPPAALVPPAVSRQLPVAWPVPDPSPCPGLCCAASSSVSGGGDLENRLPLCDVLVGKQLWDLKAALGACARQSLSPQPPPPRLALVCRQCHVTLPLAGHVTCVSHVTCADLVTLHFHVHVRRWF